MKRFVLITLCLATFAATLTSTFAANCVGPAPAPTKKWQKKKAKAAAAAAAVVDAECAKFTEQLNCSLSETPACRWVGFNTIQTPLEFCEAKWVYGATGPEYREKANADTAALRKKCADISVASDCNSQPACHWNTNYNAAKLAIDVLKEVNQTGWSMQRFPVSDARYKDFWYLWEIRQQYGLPTKYLTEEDRKAIKARLAQ